MIVTYNNVRNNKQNDFGLCFVLKSKWPCRNLIKNANSVKKISYNTFSEQGFCQY